MKESVTLKKAYLALGVVVALSGIYGKKAHSQAIAGNYSFTQTSGTFTPITGGTVVNASIPDSYQSGAITLTPGFPFCGTVYTTAYMTSNGLISLGGTAGPGTTQYNGIANNGAGSGIHICPFNANQIGSTLTGAAPEMRYELVGNVHVFQWKDISRVTGAVDRFSYQARLNATTGVITFVYTVTTVGTATTNQPVIGIRTATTAGDWQSRLVANNATSSWAASDLALTTADLVRFTSSATNPKQPLNGQTYIYTPPPSCTAVTAPAAAPINALPTAICVSGTTNLSLQSPMPITTGYTYQWQRSTTTAAGPYTTIANTATPAYVAAVNTTSYYRCRVLCNNDSISPFWTSGASAQVVVSNPGIPTVTPGSRCGPGSVALAATLPPGGVVLNWYAAAVGGVPLGTGTSFNTPPVPTTTNFYVASSTSASSGPVVKITEMDLGSTDGLEIQNVGSSTVDVTGWRLAISDDYGTITIVNAIIQNLTGTMAPGAIRSWSDNSAATNYWGNNIFWNPGAFPGFSGWALLLDNNNNIIDFVACNWPVATIQATTLTIGATPVNLATAWSGPPLDGNNAAIVAGSSFQRIGSVDLNTAADFTAATPTVGTTNTGIIMPFAGSACEGPRVAVAATVNPSPVVARTSPLSACNNTATAITLTPPSPPYPNYTWTPVTNLYTDAAASIPYTTGGSATNVYMKSTNVGIQTYYMMAGNPNSTTGCTFADTVRIWSQPGNVTIKAQPDTICVSGFSTLSLDTIAGYYPGSIQWQDSIPGTSTSFTNIAGANSPTYVTPNLIFGQDRFYRAQIRSSSGICQNPTKYIVIANPTVISAPDSFNCGPGTVTLSAVTGGNGSPVWYQNATGGLPLASGSPFVTPFLAATTSYYVSSGGGGSAGLQTIGAGALVSATQSVTPFSSGWGASKHQYLIRAAELTAAGIPSGATLTSLALDVVAGGTTYPGFAISMKNTTTAALPTSYETGVAPVKLPANVTTAAGINTYTFDAAAPFVWDGTSNLLIQTCWSNGLNVFNATGSTVRYDNTTYVATRRGQIDNITAADMCAATTPSSSANYSQRPKFIIGYDDRCESPRQEVIAYIHPVPDVDLGNDINECVDAGAVKVLDAGVQQHNPQFLWDNGSTSQVRGVTTTGTYSVTVTNQYTCQDKDTINVILRKNPEVDLGNDTSVCNGVVLPLNAGSEGISYFWNTGENSQVIQVSSPGTYNVFVTNSQGCTKVDTIVVDMAGQLPSINGIQITNNGVNTFTFTAVNPQNVIGYDWDFGDGTAHSYQAAPTHTYANSGNYVVVLKLSSSCGFLDDSTSAHIVGINQLNVNNNELMIYPNPSRETATILNKGLLKMEKIEVYNVLGQVIYTAKADSKDKHMLDLGGVASGIYTIQVYTDKGTVARKLEILK